MSSLPDDADNTAADLEFLRNSTLPKNVSTHLRAFATEEAARDAAHLVHAWLMGFGTFLNLERLDGITIAYDYDAALAELDRGFEASAPLIATNEEFARGMAMAPPVLRNGEVKAHIVLHAALVEGLQDREHEGHRIAIYTLAHEAAHVHDLGVKVRTLPGIVLSVRLSQEDSVFFQIADACWSEYAACRLSAQNGPEELEPLEDTFCRALEGTRERGNDRIREYRWHGGTQRLLGELVKEYGSVAKYGSYLLGHVAGLERPFSDAAPRAHALIQKNSYFVPLFEQLTQALESMWATYGSWVDGLTAYEPLTRFARELLRVAGVELRTLPQGLYMDVPFTDETLPS